VRKEIYPGLAHAMNADEIATARAVEGGNAAADGDARRRGTRR
jgi:hypothetical protein